MVLTQAGDLDVLDGLHMVFAALTQARGFADLKSGDQRESCGALWNVARTL